MKIIKQEIDEINDVIRLTIDFQEEYPDDNALSLSLRSLKSKQSLLFKELGKANLKTMRESFDIILDWGTVPNTMISLSFAGQILTSLQDVITSLVQKQVKKDINTRTHISNDVKKMSQLNVLATGVGSFRIVVTPDITSFSSELNPPPIEALEQFNELLECFDDIDKIKQKRLLMGGRVVYKYKEFMHVLVQNNSSALFYDMLGKHRFPSIKITKKLANDIYNTLNKIEEMPEQTESLNGKLRGIDTITKNFRFELEDENYITGKYDTFIEDKVTNPDFEEEKIATFKHTISFNEVLDEEKDDWMLIDINPLIK